MRNIQVSGISSGRKGKRSEEQPLRKKWNNKLIPTEHYFFFKFRTGSHIYRTENWEYSYLMHCCLTKEAARNSDSEFDTYLALYMRRILCSRPGKRWPTNWNLLTQVIDVDGNRYTSAAKTNLFFSCWKVVGRKLFFFPPTLFSPNDRNHKIFWLANLFS